MARTIAETKATLVTANATKARLARPPTGVVVVAPPQASISENSVPAKFVEFLFYEVG
jgi:hypothetical protein